MAVSFVESDMTFGEYPDQYFFQIEQSGQYRNLKDQNDHFRKIWQQGQKKRP